MAAVDSFTPQIYKWAKLRHEKSPDLKSLLHQVNYALAHSTVTAFEASVSSSSIQ